MIEIRKPLFVFCGLLFSIITLSSAQSIFQKTYGGVWADLGQSLQQTSDGGFVIGGSTQSFSTGDYDLYLIRTDINGDTLWTSVISTSFPLTDMGFSSDQTDDGGFVITGRTLDIGTNSTDVFLVKTDSLGSVLWAKTYGGIADQTGYSIEHTTDGGYIIGGDSKSFMNFDIYLVKTNDNGDILWFKAIGGANDEHGNSTVQTTDGGFIVAGSTNSNGAGVEDVLLVKTDSVGNSLWAKTYGGSEIDVAYSVQQSNDGGFIIGGLTTSFAPVGYSKVYLIKTDNNGDTLWTKIFSPGIGYNIGAYSIRQTTSGGYIVAGNTNGFGAGGYDIYLIRTDVNGNLIWSKTYGGVAGEFGKSVLETIEGGFVVAGYTNNFGVGGIDVYLIKTDSLGNSGCNEINVTTVEESPATIVGSFTPASSSIGASGAPATILQRGGSITTLCSGYVGINDVVALNSMVIAPNPTSGNFTIKLTDYNVGGEIQIYNVYGSLIFSKTIQHTVIAEINLNIISKGVYFVKLINGEKSYCQKIIVEED